MWQFKLMLVLLCVVILGSAAGNKLILREIANNLSETKSKGPTNKAASDKITPSKDVTAKKTPDPVPSHLEPFISL